MAKTILQTVGWLATICVPLQAFLLGCRTGRTEASVMWARPAALLRFILATFVVMPALAVAMGAFRIAPLPVWTGLLLISMTPPGMSAWEKGTKLKGDDQAGLSWQTTALWLSIGTIPLTLFIIERRLGLDIELGILPVTQKVLVAYLVPMIVGHLLHGFLPTVASGLRRALTPLWTVLTVVLLILVLILAAPLLVRQPVSSLLFTLGFVAVAIGVGYLFGGPPANLRPTLAAALAMRWMAPALLLAQLNNAVKEIAPVLLTYVLGGALLMALAGKLARPRSSGAAANPVERR